MLFGYSEGRIAITIFINGFIWANLTKVFSEINLKLTAIHFVIIF